MDSSSAKEHAFDIHKKSIVINAADSSLYRDDYRKKLDAGGVTATNFTVPLTTDDFGGAVNKIEGWYTLAEKSPDNLSIAISAEDIENTKKSSGFAAIIGMQSPRPFGSSLSFLRTLYRIGTRVSTLAYSESSLLGGGCVELNDSGLSRFGFKVVDEMNKLGMVIDLSHVGWKTSEDAINSSRDPVIFSHSNALELCVNVRNLPNNLIQMAAEKGGVIGIVASSPFLRADARPNLSNFLDQIDYFSRFVGIDHVGIGLDIGDGRPTREEFDALMRQYPEQIKDSPYLTYDTRAAEGIDDVSKMSSITVGLVERGYSDDEIRKVLGLNFLRLFKRVWRN